MIAFVLCHFVPFFAWLPTFVCRCEVLLISSWSRATAWLAAVPFDAVVYVLVLANMNKPAPTAVLMHIAGVSIVGVSAMVSWILAAFV